MESHFLALFYVFRNNVEYLKTTKSRKVPGREDFLEGEFQQHPDKRVCFKPHIYIYIYIYILCMYVYIYIYIYII